MEYIITTVPHENKLLDAFVQAIWKWLTQRICSYKIYTLSTLCWCWQYTANTRIAMPKTNPHDIDLSLCIKHFSLHTWPFWLGALWNPSIWVFCWFDHYYTMHIPKHKVIWRISFYKHKYIATAYFWATWHCHGYYGIICIILVAVQFQIMGGTTLCLNK